MISMQRYREKQALYTRSLCEDHNRDFGMCCKLCLTLKCPNCVTANDCAGKGVSIFFILEVASSFSLMCCLSDGRHIGNTATFAPVDF